MFENGIICIMPTKYIQGIIRINIKEGNFMLDYSGIVSSDYTPVCDIIVMAMCMIMGILLHLTFLRKNTRFHTMLMILTIIWGASATNLIYEAMLYSAGRKLVPLCIMRALHHVILILVPYMYARYLYGLFWFNPKEKNKIISFSVPVIFATVIVDVLGTVLRFGFYIEDNVLHRGFNPYVIVYSVFTYSSIFMILKHRRQVIGQLFWGLLSVHLISLFILFIQGIHGQVIFTSLSSFIPVLGFIFMFHSNPYDIDLGTVSGDLLESVVNDYIEKEDDFILMSCTMVEFSKLMKNSNELKTVFYKFMRNYVKKGIIYRFPNEKMVFAMPMNRVPDCDKMIESMVDDFENCYHDFKIDYKIVIMKSNGKIKNGSDYLKLVEFAEQEMCFNVSHTIDDTDIDKFYNSSYILSQLEDIMAKKNLSDERVLVYCQPVFNVSTGKYDTAEALMRLKLDNLGLVFPDKFIPIAEQYNMIHSLSMIILNKTCKAISQFISEGYEINRVSVNFSALDIRYDSFCMEVKKIIDSNMIPYEKIAVEITESRSESDFNIMKQRVVQLQELGIKFYLDDFGTGYSNFERIMEIPFDIIKFDRSMLIESVKNDSSKFMVSTFANMFNKLNYSILFEGVEDVRDESHCISMEAKYLQGYKYSKPIPIENLRDFLTKIS